MKDLSILKYIIIVLSSVALGAGGYYLYENQENILSEYKIDFSQKNHFLVNQLESPEGFKKEQIVSEYEARMILDNVPYKQDEYGYYDERHTFDLYGPVIDNGMESLPLVVMVHSGAFISGSKEDDLMVSMAHDLAQKGLLVASVGYRIFESGWNDKQSTWGNELFKYNKFAKETIYTAHADVYGACRFFYSNASQYNIDINKIYLMGYSAGGIITNDLMHMTEYDFQSFFGNGYVSCLNCLSYIGQDEYAPQDLSFIKGYISIAGATVEAASVGDNQSVPGLFIHGNADEIVDIGSAKPFKKYNKDQTFSIGVPELFVDLGISNSNLDKFDIGGVELGTTVPRSIMNLLINIFSPDLYGSRSIFNRKTQACTFVELNGSDHVFSRDEEWEYETMMWYVKKFLKY